MVRHHREYLHFREMRDLKKLPKGLKTWMEYQKFLDQTEPGWRTRSDAAQGWTERKTA